MINIHTITGEKGIHRGEALSKTNVGHYLQDKFL